MTAALLRAGAAGLALLVLVLAAGQTAVKALLPAMQWVFEALVDDFRVLRFGFDHEGADLVLRVVVKVAHYAVVGERVMTPDGNGLANASTMAVQGLQGAFVALWIALAWPAAGSAGLADAFKTRLRRLAWVALPALLLLLLDAPLVMAASLWQFVIDGLSPGAFSPLLLARELLQGGGRLALGAAMGGAAVVLAARHGRSATA
jgi:hypothetical protein